MIAPLTPSVALLASGRWGLTPSDSAARTRQDWLRSPPRHGRRASPVQSAFHRRRARRRSLSRCLAARRRRCLPTSTIREHSPRSPETLVLAVEPASRDDVAFRGSRPLRPSTIPPGSVGLRAGATPAELQHAPGSAFAVSVAWVGDLLAQPPSPEQDQIGSRRTGAAPPRAPGGASGTRACSRSAWLGHLLS